MNQISENGEKSNIGLDFGSFSPNFVLKLFSWVLLLLDVIHCKLSLYAISRKTKDPTSRKLCENFGLDLHPLHPNLDHQFFFNNMVSSVTRYHGQQ